MAQEPLPPAQPQRRKLLILENDRGLRRELEQIFADLDVTSTETSEQALALVRRLEPDVVLFDLGTAREPAVAAQSLELLRQILNLSPDIKIIAMTEHDARELAVTAVGLGATDFYHKPIDGGVLSIVVRRAFRIRELEEENWRLRERTGSMALDGIIGVSDSMRSVCRSIEKVAPTNATVLLLGDSGTGKELLARAVHRLSGRSHLPFVAINCAAIPDNAARKRAVRIREGRLHRRNAHHARQARSGQRRHGVPRRDRRDAGLVAGEAAARAAGADRRTRSAAERPFPSTCASSAPPIAISRCASASGSFREDLVLSHRRGDDSRAAAARASGR